MADLIHKQMKSTFFLSFVQECEFSRHFEETQSQATKHWMVTKLKAYRTGEDIAKRLHNLPEFIQKYFSLFSINFAYI